MEIAYQVPIPDLKRYQGDFDFALAHLVLTDPDYRAFYRGQKEKGRYVMLDNSIHELGRPLPLGELMEAAEYINPDVVIPPDWMGNAEATLNAAIIAVDAFGSSRLAPVAQGTTMEEMRSSYWAYLRMGVPCVCFPYRAREERLKLIPHLTGGVRHHFLSFTYAAEVERLAETSNASLDTGKPFRYAQARRPIPLTDRDASPPQKLDMYTGCPEEWVFRNVSTLQILAAKGALK